jgi:hypothetical protein
MVALTLVCIPCTTPIETYQPTLLPPCSLLLAELWTSLCEEVGMSRRSEMGEERGFGEQGEMAVRVG